MSHQSTAQSTPNPRETLKYLPDAIEYTFQDALPMQADNQHTTPLDFSITLPLNPVAKYNFGIDAFGFSYDQRQVVYIYLDYIPSNKTDTAYLIKDKLEIEELLVDKLNYINDSTQLNIAANPFLQDRKTFICRKGHATILLYNIVANQFKKFLHAALSFSFLAKS